MLLKQYKEKNENEDVTKIKSLYDSSNVLGAEYDRSTSTLSIIFNRGVKYNYFNVRETDFSRFDTSESQGKALNEVIKKGGFKYEKEDEVDPRQYENEIKDLIKERLQSIYKELKEKMDESIEIYDELDGNFRREDLEELEVLIREAKKYF